MDEHTEETKADRDRATLVKQQALMIILLVLLVGVQAWQLIGGMSVKAQTWEYTIDSPPDEQLPGRLKTLGANGWEIVSARRATSKVGDETVASYEMILKR